MTMTRTIVLTLYAEPASETTRELLELVKAAKISKPAGAVPAGGPEGSGAAASGPSPDPRSVPAPAGEGTPDREGWWRSRNSMGIWSCVYVERFDRDGALLAELNGNYYDLDEIGVEWGGLVVMPGGVASR